MNERPLTLCASALLADGQSAVEVTEALGIDEDLAQRLIEMRRAGPPGLLAEAGGGVSYRPLPSNTPPSARVASTAATALLSSNHPT